MKNFAAYLANLPKTPLVEAVQSLYEASEGNVENGSAWNDVERIHVYHAADPRMDMDIKLDSLWATRQKDSASRQEVINRFVEDVEDFNKWLATSDDGGAFITSASIKFKGDPDAVTVDIQSPSDGQSLLESYYGPWNFKSVQELRDFVDQKTYERFNMYSKDEVASGKTPFGSLEAIKAIDMDTFLKSVGDKGYDIVDDMKNQLVDANYINNLSYDWFISLFNMKVLGWTPKTEN